MTMYTYAQNGEDVILQRVFRHIETGFYVDVGAQDPVVDSVTKAFYELGWHGINVEPASTYLNSLKQDRSRDLNLGIVVTDTPGMTAFFRIPDSGLSTTQPRLADKAAKQHGFAVHEEFLPSLTLSQILQSVGKQEVHFLKIDVEGGEAAVIRGLNLSVDRPWVILVESTEPMTTHESFQEWEPDLLQQGYEFVFCDGLNRYYLASEQPDLRESFRTPPNIFDEAVPHALVRIHRQLEDSLSQPFTHSLANVTDYFRAIETQIASLAKQHETALEAVAASRAEHAMLYGHLESVKKSWSWKLTAPQREVGRAISKISNFLGSTFGSPSSQQGETSTRIFGRYGLIRNQLRRVEKEFRRFRRRISSRKVTQEFSSIASPLTERTKEIHADLVNAISLPQQESAARHNRAA